MTDTRYVCTQCGSIHSKWSGRCDDCGAWNSLQEEIIEAVPKSLSASDLKKSGKSKSKQASPDIGIQLLPTTISADAPKRIKSDNDELDRVLGGGIVPGSAILIGGDPGIGKSTLLLQLAAHLSQNEHKCYYISGEESAEQIALRAERLGIMSAPIHIAITGSVRQILTQIEAMKPTERPSVIIVDSIQTMYLDFIDNAPGTVSQVRACANELIRIAKKFSIALFLVGHVTKEGQIAGPRVMEHMVDSVLYFEGERGYNFRILRAVKNRFGATDEIGVFEMRTNRLMPIANPSALFLSNRSEEVNGSAIFAGIEGTRPILVEIQALVAKSSMAQPRRAVIGWDNNRLAMILAVLEARCGLALGMMDIYLNVAGGFKIRETAADLAVAAALISAFTGNAIETDQVFFGEIGLSGEIRQVSKATQRLKESAKLGFNSAVIPKGLEKGEEKNELNQDIKIFEVEKLISLVQIYQ